MTTEDELTDLRQRVVALRSSLAACLIAMRADGIDTKWRMVTAEARALVSDPTGPQLCPVCGERVVVPGCAVCQPCGDEAEAAARGAGVTAAPTPNLAHLLA